MRRRTSNVFGSLRSQRSQRSTEDGDNNNSEDGDNNNSEDEWSSVVIHHGEIPTTSGGMWRKRSQYLVLTDTHLIRFRSQNKAADVFPSVVNPTTASRPSRQSSISMVMQDQQHSTGEAIPLHSIIAVYLLEDSGRNNATAELAYLDERAHKASLIQIHAPEDALNLWMGGIRSAAQLARSVNPLPIDQTSIDSVNCMLEHERDYDPATFRLFRVLQMASTKSSAGSADDLTKVSPTGCYLAIGSHKLHLIPFQKATRNDDLETWSSSFGLMALTGLSMEWGDDSLHLTFRYGS